MLPCGKRSYHSATATWNIQATTYFSPSSLTTSFQFYLCHHQQLLFDHVNLYIDWISLVFYLYQLFAIEKKHKHISFAHVHFIWILSGRCLIQFWTLITTSRFLTSLKVHLYTGSDCYLLLHCLSSWAQKHICCCFFLRLFVYSKVVCNSARERERSFRLWIWKIQATVWLRLQKRYNYIVMGAMMSQCG